MEKCTRIIFSDRACNALVSEARDTMPAETGGILLGRIDGSVWYVAETVNAGSSSICSLPYTEYDMDDVNQLTKMVSEQYFTDLEVLGVWHSRPVSSDILPMTGKVTNQTFPVLNEKGMISCVLSTSPQMRLTVYHVSSQLEYEKVPFVVADHLIPENLFRYKHAEEIKMINFYQYCLPVVILNFIACT